MARRPTLETRPSLSKWWVSEAPITNYTYLKLKMPGPKGVITVSFSYEHTQECDVECVKYGEAVENTIELDSRLEALAAEALEPMRHAGSFEPAEGTKKIPLDPDNSDGKVLTISANLDPKYEAVLVDFLRANADMFAWSPSDMPGIPREVAEHSLEIRASSKLVNQRLRRFDEEKRKIIGEEVHKLLTAGFIKEVHHPDWLANPVLVKKKNGKIRMCVNYTSLNKACPKVPFHLPCTDQIVDYTDPILVAPRPAKPLLLYVAATTQVISAAVVVERPEEGHALPVQRLVYFISKVLSETKVRYP